jgi:hypothetical protein
MPPPTLMWDRASVGGRGGDPWVHGADRGVRGGVLAGPHTPPPQVLVSAALPD